MSTTTMHLLLDAVAMLLFAVVLGAGRRLHGSAWFGRVTGRGPTTARLVGLGLPATLLAVPIIGWWAPVLGALVFAGSTLPQRGMALKHWYDPFYIGARAIAVGVIVAPLLWWLGSPLWWLPALVGILAPSLYALAHEHDGVAEFTSYAFFGLALGAALVTA